MKHTEKSIGTLRFDRRGELLSISFFDISKREWNYFSMKLNFIRHDSVHNGFVSLSVCFWGYALETTCHVLNSILSKSVAKTPYGI